MLGVFFVDAGPKIEQVERLRMFAAIGMISSLDVRPKAARFRKEWHPTCGNHHRTLCENNPLSGLSPKSPENEHGSVAMVTSLHWSNRCHWRSSLRYRSSCGGRNRESHILRSRALAFGSASGRPHVRGCEENEVRNMDRFVRGIEYTDSRLPLAAPAVL